jgi:hypothetical protein
MALNATTLGTAIKNAFTSNGALDNAATAALSNAIATAVVNHITANAAVSVTTVSACTAGGATGTGTGTVA